MAAELGIICPLNRLLEQVIKKYVSFPAMTYSMYDN